MDAIIEQTEETYDASNILAQVFPHFEGPPSISMATPLPYVLAATTEVQIAQPLNNERLVNYEQIEMYPADTTSCGVLFEPRKRRIHTENRNYNCAFPGCKHTYVTTDGLRKHARKKHPGFAAKCKGQPKLLVNANNMESSLDSIESVQEFVDELFDFSRFFSV